MDNIFTIHKFVIQDVQIGEKYHLIPIGDVHRFASLCDENKWLEFLGEARAQKNWYFLGMGDYLDLASFSERKILGSTDLHDFTIQTLDKLYQEQCDRFISEIAFMRGRIIGMIEGNHHGVFSNSNFTTTQYMCQKLGCKYLGVSAFIRLSMHYRRKTACIDIWAHHGKGASRMVGGSLNTVQQMADCADADIYLMGHDHKKSVATKTRLTLSGGRDVSLNNKKVLLGRTGAFLKGYVPEQPSYIARSAMSPTDLGVIKIEMTPRREAHVAAGQSRRDSYFIDLHASI